jgi:hypothetical protein
LEDSVKSLESSGSTGGVSWNSTVSGWALKSGDGNVTARNSATTAALAQITLDNAPSLYTLVPPAGARFNGGKLVVYASLKNADIVGAGSLELQLDAEMFGAQYSDNKGTQRRVVTNRPGNDTVEVATEVPLPADLDSTRSYRFYLTVHLKAVANVAPTGGVIQTGEAQADAEIVGFSVLDATGVPLVGFSMSGTSGSPSKKLVERAPAPGLGKAVEFYHQAFGHFFITSNPGENAALRSGTAWAPTGESFNVYTSSGAGLAGVCRFFGEFPVAGGAKSSHFYTANAAECESLKKSATWKFEGVVFYMPMPDASGACPDGTNPVYRLYNDGKGGAPNHRFTANGKTQGETSRDGYSLEGVAMCAPQ